VKEIRCIVMVPQVGNTRDVQLPPKLPVHESLRGHKALEPLGVIHTISGSDTPYMSSMDVTVHSRLLEQHQHAWAMDKSITMTVSFTPGSVSLSAWTLTAAGFAWGKENKDIQSDQPQGFSTTFGERCQLLLSDKIKGYFLVPEGNSGVWNYGFMGSSFSAIEKQNAGTRVTVDIPLTFYADAHRPLHFQNFAELEDIWVDRNDNFA